MHILSKKTTILFSPDLYQQLHNLSKTFKTSMAELIRQAVIKQYLLSDKKKRLEAVKNLAKIGGKSPNWKTMEYEIIKGHNLDNI